MTGPADAAPPVGLRERKRQRTRTAIYEAAVALFLEQGYEATTLAQIAARAEVSPRTFFGYFTGKEAVLLAAYEPRLAALPQRLRDRPAGVDAVEVVRAWFLDELVGDGPPDPRLEQLVDRIAAGQGALLSTGIGGVAGFEQVVAAALADDLGVPGDAVEARVAASALLAAFYRATLGPDGTPLDDRTALELNIGRAVALLRHGLGALAAAG